MGPRRRPAVAGTAAVALTGCGSSLASAPALQHTVSTSSHLAVARRGAAIDRLAVIPRRRYSEEVHGAAVHKQLRRVAADPVLLHALRAHDFGGLRLVDTMSGGCFVLSLEAAIDP